MYYIIMKLMDFETGVRLLRWVSESPVFKGWSLVILGTCALAFGWYIKKDKKKFAYDYIIFMSVAAFIIAYGIFLLLARPLWWNPPI